MSFFQCLQSALNIVGAQENPDLVEETVMILINDTNYRITSPHMEYLFGRSTMSRVDLCVIRGRKDLNK